MAKKNANGWDDPEIRQRRIDAIRAALAKKPATKKAKKVSKSPKAKASKSPKAKASKAAKQANKASPKPAATQAKQQPDAKLAKALHTLESRVKVTPINSLPATA